MTTTLKVQHGDEIYRLAVEGAVTYEAVVHTVTAALTELPPAAIATGLKYVDDEGELCTLTSLSFDDFTEVASTGGVGSGSRVLKLQLKLSPGGHGGQTGTAAVPAAATSPPLAAAAQSPVAGAATASGEGEVGEDEDGDSSEDQDENAGESPGFGQQGWPLRGGLRKLVRMLKGLQDSGFPLQPGAMAGFAVMWLPAIAQSVVSQVETINRKAKKGIDDGLLRLLKVVQEIAASTPGLEQAAKPFAEAIAAVETSSGPTDLGNAILGLLLELCSLAKEAQLAFAQRVIEVALPMLDELSSKWCRHRRGHDSHGHGHGRHSHDDGHHSHDHGSRSPRGRCRLAKHRHVTCDGCGMNPLMGIRFHCTVCPDYDLCEACHQRKSELHHDCPGGQMDFAAIPYPWKGHGWKGHGKGFGKGFGKCGKWGGAGPFGKGLFGKGGFGKGCHKGGKAWLAAMLSGDMGSWMPGCCPGAEGAQEPHAQGGGDSTQQRQCQQPSGCASGGGAGSGSSGPDSFAWPMEGPGDSSCPFNFAPGSFNPFVPFSPFGFFGASAPAAPEPEPAKVPEESCEHPKQQDEGAKDLGGDVEMHDVASTPSTDAAAAVPLPADVPAEAPAAEAAGEAPAAEAANAALATSGEVDEVVEVVVVEDHQVDEFAQQLATLRELGLGSDDVNRDLLTATGGDTSRVAQMLLGD